MGLPWPDEPEKSESSSLSHRLSVSWFHRSRLYILFIVLISLFVLYLFDKGAFDNKPQDYWTGYIGQIRNPLDHGENMTMRINFESKTFGAQDNIAAFVTLDSNQSRLHTVGKTLPSQYFLLNFERTYCGEKPPPDPFQPLFYCAIKLVPTFNTTDLSNGEVVYHATYKGQGNISFSYGGDFHVYLSKELISNVENETTSSTAPVIRISPVDATNSYKQAQNTFNTWKVTVTIAVIAAIIGALNLYSRYSERKPKSS